MVGWLGGVGLGILRWFIGEEGEAGGVEGTGTGGGVWD